MKTKPRVANDLIPLCLAGIDCETIRNHSQGNVSKVGCGVTMTPVVRAGLARAKAQLCSRLRGISRAASRSRAVPVRCAGSGCLQAQWELS